MWMWVIMTQWQLCFIRLITVSEHHGASWVNYSLCRLYCCYFSKVSLRSKPIHKSATFLQWGLQAVAFHISKGRLKDRLMGMMRGGGRRCLRSTSLEERRWVIEWWRLETPCTSLQWLDEWWDGSAQLGLNREVVGGWNALHCNCSETWLFMFVCCPFSIRLAFFSSSGRFSVVPFSWQKQLLA